MAIKAMTGDTVWNSGISGRINGINCLKYSGTLGGGTLTLYSLSTDVDPVTGAAIETPVANGKLSAATTDANGDSRKQLVFQTLGPIIVKLTGSTTPDVKVMVE